MGYFDMPSGRFELLMKEKGRGNHKPEWKCVALTDSLFIESIADRVEHWEKHYKVIAARFNGRDVTIPTSYHWEHRNKDEVLGVFKTRDDALAAVKERKHFNWGKPRDEHIPVGSIRFVQD